MFICVFFMASKATGLEYIVEERARHAWFDYPIRHHDLLSRDEQMRLLRQVRRGTAVLRLDAKKTKCSLDEDKVILSSVLSEKLKHKLDWLVSNDYIQKYRVYGNNGASTIEMERTEDNGCDCTKTGRTIALAFRHKSAVEAKEKLMLGNQRLVISRANRIRRNYFIDDSLFGDLINEGQFGLYRAIDQYRPERHREFSTYAVRSIDNAIRRAMRVMGKIVVVSHPMASLASAVERDACNNKTSFTEAGRERNLLPQTITTALRAKGSMNITSFSMPFGKDDEEFESIIPYQGASVDEVVENSLMKEYIRELVDKLPEGERQVITLRYLCENRPKFDEVGRYLGVSGVSKEWARQIEASAIKRLRRYAGVDKLR